MLREPGSATRGHGCRNVRPCHGRQAGALHYTLLDYVILYYIILYHIILYYIILYYIIVYYIILII